LVFFYTLTQRCTDKHTSNSQVDKITHILRFSAGYENRWNVTAYSVRKYNEFPYSKPANKFGIKVENFFKNNS